LKARDDETPSLVMTRASWIPTGQSFAIVTTYLLAIGFPASSTFGTAVTPACEKLNWSAFSKFAPAMVISTLVPTRPPIGIVVRIRGAGRQTACAHPVIVIKCRTVSVIKPMTASIQIRGTWNCLWNTKRIPDRNVGFMIVFITSLNG